MGLDDLDLPERPKPYVGDPASEWMFYSKRTYEEQLRYYPDKHKTSTGRRRPARCGTRSGHQAHVRRGERPCSACANATAEYYRNRRRQPKLPAGHTKETT